MAGILNATANLWGIGIVIQYFALAYRRSVRIRTSVTPLSCKELLAHHPTTVMTVSFCVVSVA
ncbi:hypothetical protein BJ508DRAFT_419694 [Ascobolus immersus RN42]|uniref:Uncharacterized protein n=1 Tax=Ascobolus immersus RN42 TaxID=1160509 RepID=A0A3N4HFU8_ASCIM|nr:hypothetical protein BJ508DRAFT_419694 [Ascobolus immersus RN42]